MKDNNNLYSYIAITYLNFYDYIKLDQRFIRHGQNNSFEHIIYLDGYFKSSKTGESEVENIENSIDSSILFLNRVRVFLAERFFANEYYIKFQ